MTPSPAPDLRRRRLLLAVALVAVLAHVGIGAGGVWSFAPLNYDDPQVLALASDTSVRDLLTQPTWYAYKPVYFLSLKIDTFLGDRVLSGAAAAVAHVHNLLLHALACGLLVLVLEGLLGNRWIAGAAGFLFAVHPVHVESVAWIAGRKDLLALVLVLGAHLVYRRARARGRASLAAPLLLALGGLAKGTVWVWPAVLLLDDVAHAAATGAWGRRGAWAARWLPCALVGLLGVLLDVWMGLVHGPGAVDHGVGLPALAAALCGVHARYVANLLLPVRLSLDYGIDPSGSWAQPAAWAGLLLLAGALALLARSLRRRSAAGLVASGLWLVGLLPVNNLWPRTAILMADRYLVVPAIGFYVLLLALLARWRGGRTAAVVVVAVLLALATVRRTAVFADSERAWADAMEAAPTSALAAFQAGQAPAGRGAWDLAAERAARAARLQPRPEILVKARLLEAGALLGALSEADARGEATQAKRTALLACAREARRLASSLDALPLVKQDPREVQAEAWVLEGQALEAIGDRAGALEAYARATRAWPRHAPAHHDLATLLAQTGSEEALAVAERHLREAVRLDPGFRDARLQLANVLALRGRPDEALRELERAEARFGRTAEILFAQAQVHLAGRHDVLRAQEILTALERWWPDDPRGSRLLADIHLAYGRTRLERGRTERDRAALREALERFEAAAKVAPRRWEPEVLAGDALLELGRFPQARARYRRAADLAEGEGWILRLVAEAAVLDAAWQERNAQGDEDRREAARLARAALEVAPTRLDLGLLPLGEELSWLARAAAAPAGAGAAEADGVLRAAALALTGDEEGARALLAEVLLRLPPSHPARDVFDAAVLLRGMLRDRAGAFDDARRDYALLTTRRPDEALPRLRGLELDLRSARARLSIAQGDAQDRERLAAALAAHDAVATLVVQLADAYPDLLAAGLLAAETEMQQQRWTQALRRLNDLAERHPEDPSVLRGQAAVYLAQYVATRVREVLDEAVRTLSKALLEDPRDPRTWLDASQLARAAGNLAGALQHAERARGYERAAGGVAARTLVDLHLALGRQALEQGDLPRALASAQAAARADARRAGPWVLRGEVHLAARRLDEAFDALRTAKELEPASLEASAGLARVHRQRALVFGLRRTALRLPPTPAGDPGTPDAAALAAWEEAVQKKERERDLWRAQELAELEAALRLDPQASEAEDVRARIATLRDQDPDARRGAWNDAEEAVRRGLELREARQPLQALEAFGTAIARWPDHARAHLLVAATAYELLRMPGGGSEEEERLEGRWLNQAFASLQALDHLDPDDRWFDRHRVRGLLDEVLLRRAGLEASRMAAIGAYRRYVVAALAGGRAENDPDVRAVRERLRALEGADEGR